LLPNLLVTGALFLLAAVSISSFAFVEGRGDLIPEWLAAIFKQWTFSPALRPLVQVLNVFVLVGTQLLAVTGLTELDLQQDPLTGLVLVLEILAVALYAASILLRWRAKPARSD